MSGDGARRSQTDERDADTGCRRTPDAEDRMAIDSPLCGGYGGSPQADNHFRLTCSESGESSFRPDSEDGSSDDVPTSEDDNVEGFAAASSSPAMGDGLSDGGQDSDFEYELEIGPKLHDEETLNQVETEDWITVGHRTQRQEDEITFFM